MAIRGNQRQSEAIRGNQRQSVAIRATWCTRPYGIQLPIENAHRKGGAPAVAAPAPKGNLVAARLLRLRQVQILVKQPALPP